MIARQRDPDSHRVILLAGVNATTLGWCLILSRPARDAATAGVVRLLPAPLVPGMRVAGHLDAQRVDRSVRATEQRPQVRSAEREVDGLLRPPDDADAPAAQRHDPDAARPGAIRPADTVDLE